MREYLYKYRRFFIVFGSILIQLTLGNYYSFGNIENKVLQFMSKCGNNCVNYNLQWVFGSIILGIGSSMTLGGYIEMKIGPSLTVLFSGWLLSLIISLMYFILRTNKIELVIVIYGLIGGMASGIAYGVSLSVSLKNFPKNKGLIIGIAVSGFGLSASIFEPIQDALIRKTSLPCSFLWLGIIFVGIQLIGSILMYDKIYERKNVMGNNDNESSDSNQSIMINEYNQYDETKEILPHQLIWELDFWILWIILLLNSFSLTVFTALSKRYWDAQEKESKNYIYQFQRISIIGSVFNFLGRIFWGYLIDKKPFRIVNFIVSICISILIGTLATITLISNFSVFAYIYGFWYVMIYFFLSGSLSVFPGMCAKLFGTKYFTHNYGMLFTAISVAATITSLVSSYFNKGDIVMLRNVFIITGSITFLSALLTLVFRGKSLISYSN